MHPGAARRPGPAAPPSGVCGARFYAASACRWLWRFARGVCRRERITGLSGGGWPVAGGGSGGVRPAARLPGAPSRLRRRPGSAARGFTRRQRAGGYGVSRGVSAAVSGSRPCRVAGGRWRVWWRPAGGPVARLPGCPVARRPCAPSRLRRRPGSAARAHTRRQHACGPGVSREASVVPRGSRTSRVAGAGPVAGSVARAGTVAWTS